MPTVFILRCEHQCYYIGKTSGNYFIEIDKHFKGKGVEWTQLHKPLNVEVVRYFCDNNDDDFYTRLYMTKYGLDKVRGGSFSQVDLSIKQLLEIYHYPIDTHITCVKCHLKGHKQTHCPFFRDNVYITHDADEDEKINNDTDEQEHKNNDNIEKKNRITSWLLQITHKIISPLKYIVEKLWSNKVDEMLSMRLGRSGSCNSIDRLFNSHEK